MVYYAAYLYGPVCTSVCGFDDCAAFAAPTILSAGVLGAQTVPPPSDRITLGVIGLGARGFYVMKQFMAQVDVRVVALCDVDSSHHRDMPPGKGTAYGLEPIKAKVDKKNGEQISSVARIAERDEEEDV